RGGETSGDRFLKLFGKPPRLTACDCERTQETTLAQTFRLISGELVDELLNAKQNRLAELAASDLSDDQIVDELYWSALTREPTPDERNAAKEHIDSRNDRRAAIEDIAWALL